MRLRYWRTLRGATHTLRGIITGSRQDVVMRLPWDGWELPESHVWEWIAEHHPLERS